MTAAGGWRRTCHDRACPTCSRCNPHSRMDTDLAGFPGRLLEGCFLLSCFPVAHHLATWLATADCLLASCAPPRLSHMTKENPKRGFRSIN